MSVLVDTPIWSLALRRRALTESERRTVVQLEELIRDGAAELIGPVRQEVLSGIRSEVQFERLKLHLAAFPDEPLVAADYEDAAWCENRCARRGVQGSPVDFTICGTAIRRGWPILTTDRDFVRFARHLPILLYDDSRRPR